MSQNKNSTDLSSNDAELDSVAVKVAANTESFHIPYHKLIKGSSENLTEIPDSSIHCTITSPPYNEDKEYKDCLEWFDYRQLILRVFSEVYRVTVPGGKVCVNMANLGRWKENGQKYKRLMLLFWCILTDLGFIDEGDKIWWKGKAANNGTAWGSYLSSASPVTQDVHEYILIFSKPDHKGNKISLESPKGIEKQNLEKTEFIQLIKSVWNIPARKHPKHQCVFPEGIAANCIKLYSFPTQTILDVFAGSGTTGRVAKQLGRNAISVEIEEKYWPLIEEDTLQESLYRFFDSQPNPRALKEESK